MTNSFFELLNWLRFGDWFILIFCLLPSSLGSLILLFFFKYSYTISAIISYVIVFPFYAYLYRLSLTFLMVDGFRFVMDFDLFLPLFLLLCRLGYSSFEMLRSVVSSMAKCFSLFQFRLLGPFERYLVPASRD